MKKSFEEALGDLLAEYVDTDPDEIMSAFELRLMAMREEQDEEG